jgi:dihydrofolate synthase/folylpolyglutamate synthase
VITQIDFDHENFLGHSIEEIAAEKAGIIKPGAWVVSAAENPGARAVIRRRADEGGARLVEIDEACRISHVSAKEGRYRFRVALSDEFGTGLKQEAEIALPLAGRFQVRNAITAIAAARLLAQRGFAISDDAIVRGLGSMRWPGRLERLQEKPAVYLDGTHNPAGAREVLAFWREHLAGRRIHLIYGAMRDKAIDEVAGLLFPHAATVILTQSPQPRSISAAALAEMTSHLAETVEVIREPGAALDRALEIAAGDDVVFATGSLYLVGDLRRHWDANANGEFAATARKNAVR